MSIPKVILVVDDSRASRMLTVAIIKQEIPEAVIHEAANANEALDLIETHKPTLAILDMNMPGISGLDLAAKMKFITPKTIRALLTANIQESTRTDAEKVGVHFFKKPVSEKVVKEILDLIA